MLINFTKMHGLGNDFMVIDGVRQKLQLTPNIIRQWADRHTGIGFDQLLLVEPAHTSSPDFFYRIFNADGTEVGQCGNGARCIALFLQDENLTSKNEITVGTLAGDLKLTLEKNNLVTVNMGVPNFDPTKIPFLTQSQMQTYKIILEQQTFEFCALSLGNPHAVILVDNIEQAPVEKIGALLSHHPSFPENANIGFMQIINPNQIGLRVYERGAGETLACGSGACAAVATGQTLNLLGKQVSVEQPGGIVTVTWESKTDPIYLTGPAVTTFRGTVNLN